MRKDERYKEILARFDYNGTYSAYSTPKYVRFKINDDFGNQVEIKEEFKTIEEFELFFDMLENVIKVGYYTNKDIKVIPKEFEAGIDISVDGKIFKANDMAVINRELELILKSEALIRIGLDASKAQESFNQLTAESKEISKIKENNIARATRIEDLKKESLFKRIKRALGITEKQPQLCLNIGRDQTELVDLKEYVDALKDEETKQEISRDDSDSIPFKTMEKLFDQIEKAILDKKEIKIDTTFIKIDDLQTAYWILDQMNSKYASKLHPNMIMVITEKQKQLRAKVEEEKAQIDVAEKKFFEISPLKKKEQNSVELPEIESEQADQQKVFRDDEAGSSDRCGFLGRKITFMRSISKDSHSFTCKVKDSRKECMSELSRIQEEQKKVLTQEERDAAFFYKTCVYRQINALLKYIKETGATIEDLKSAPIYAEQVAIIQDLFRRQKNPTKAEIEEDKKIRLSQGLMAIRSGDNPMQNYSDKIFNQYYGDGSFEHCSELVSNILLPNLKSALKKVITKQDLVVYRGTIAQENNVGEKGGIVSTSLDVNTAKFFLKSRQMEKETRSGGKIYRINIPAGSPIILYSTDLITNGAINSDNPIRDDQQEIIIDPELYDFVITRANIHNSTSYEDIQACPKRRRELDIKQADPHDEVVN